MDGEVFYLETTKTRSCVIFFVQLARANYSYWMCRHLDSRIKEGFFMMRKSSSSNVQFKDWKTILIQFSLCNECLSVLKWNERNFPNSTNVFLSLFSSAGKGLQIWEAPISSKIPFCTMSLLWTSDPLLPIKFLEQISKCTFWFAIYRAVPTCWQQLLRWRWWYSCKRVLLSKADGGSRKRKFNITAN